MRSDKKEEPQKSPQAGIPADVPMWTILEASVFQLAQFAPGHTGAALQFSQIQLLQTEAVSDFSLHSRNVLIDARAFICVKTGLSYSKMQKYWSKGGDAESFRTRRSPRGILTDFQGLQRSSGRFGAQNCVRIFEDCFNF